MGKGLWIASANVGYSVLITKAVPIFFGPLGDSRPPYFSTKRTRDYQAILKGKRFINQVEEWRKPNHILESVDLRAFFS